MNQRVPSKSRWIRIFAVLIWAGLILFALLHRDEITPETILNYTPREPVLAAVVVLALFVLKSVTFVFYSGILYLANGLLFPLPAAIALNVCGTVVMVLVPYFLARRLGAEYAEALRAKHPKLRAVESLRNRNGVVFAALLRSVKLVNFDVGSMYMGAVRLSLSQTVLGSILGMVAEIVFFPIIGANLGNPHAPAFWMALGVNLLVVAAALVISKQITKRQKT